MENNNLQINLSGTPWQADVLEAWQMLVFLLGAADTGKSFIIRMALSKICLEYPGALHFATAPTYTQAHRAIVEPLDTFFSNIQLPNQVQPFNFYYRGKKQNPKGLNIVETNKSEGVLEFFNGSIIYIYASEKLAGRIKSLEFSCGYIEEATEIKTDQIEEIVFSGCIRCRQEGMPNHLYLAMNPNMNRLSWLYENFVDPIGRKAYEDNLEKVMLEAGFNAEEAQKRSRVFFKQMPFKEGYHTGNKEREAKTLMGSERQRRIYHDGEVVSLEGQAYDLRIGHEIVDFDESQFDKFYLTFDYGFSPDPMVYLLETVKSGIIYTVDEIVLYETGVSAHPMYLAKWSKAFLDLLDDSQKKEAELLGVGDYNIAGYTGETATGSGEIRKMLKPLGLRYYLTVKKREIGWTTISDDINLERWKVHPRCKHVIRSANNLIWTNTTRGVDVEGEFDDPMDAHRYFRKCPFIEKIMERSHDRHV